jgi:hypothetical protein
VEADYKRVVASIDAGTAVHDRDSHRRKCLAIGNAPSDL